MYVDFTLLSETVNSSGTCFYILPFRTHFRRYRGIGSRFHILHSRTCFRRYRGRRILFSYFACPDSFSAESRASGAVFMFCAPELVFGGIDVVWSRFHILRARTHFRRYQGRRVPFSCFVRHNSLSAVPTALGPVFMLCAPEHVFDLIEN
jgi:hypothetical protein